MKMSEIKFKRDTAFRKQFFVPDSFAHPAKMDAQLLIWIVEKYTKPGETILDPMAGSCTTMLACGLGRNVVLVELEEKYCKMCKSNWEKVSAMPQLGYEMGQCNIIQGDARQLEGLLVDKCIFSPPYAEESFYYSKSYLKYRPQIGRDPSKPSQQTEGYGSNPDNISNLPYGQIDKIVTSPPFQEPEIRRSGQVKSRDEYSYGSKLKMSSEHPDNISKLAERNYGNIDSILEQGDWMLIDGGQAFLELPSNWRQGDIALTLFTSISGDEFKQNSSVFLLDLEKWQELRQKFQQVSISGHLTTPNLFASLSSICPESDAELRECFSRPVNSFLIAHTEGHNGTQPFEAVLITLPLLDNMETPLTIKDTSQVSPISVSHYSKDNRYSDKSQVKSDSYLEVMLQVYQQCHKVLKPLGLMILVTKNFIRDKQIVRLDEDTIKLCEQAGFSFLERHYRKLLAQSFWRTIYHQKYPGVEQINYEDILAFQKKEAGGGEQ